MYPKMYPKKKLDSVGRIGQVWMEYKQKPPQLRGVSDQLGLHWICIWCPEAESNHRHEDFQSTALPTELSGRVVAGLLQEARIKPAWVLRVNTGLQKKSSFING